jgi:hypothetical protein
VPADQGQQRARQGVPVDRTALDQRGAHVRDREARWPLSCFAR